MPTYLFQYRAEARHEFEITADTEAEATAKAHVKSQEINLFGPDNTSDDPGEVELLETIEDGEPDYEAMSQEALLSLLSISHTPGGGVVIEGPPAAVEIIRTFIEETLG
jgi:hypothetical protein